jgi:SRSO17 transposase
MLQLKDVEHWGREVETVAERIGPRFSRKDLRVHAARYLAGLISNVSRKNGWQLAERLCDQSPTNLQHFIARAQWNADEVRDDLTQYVVDHLGDDDGVLIVDETGFLKKGSKSAGVARMYSGTAGRIESCQIGVFLAYATGQGQAFLDRELYLPEAWTKDRARCRDAHIPDDVSFATKGQLARRMLERAIKANVPARWVTADEVYGSDYQFRRFCEQQRLGYVVAISSATHLFFNGRRIRVSAHLSSLPQQAWQRLSCGAGAKGQRWYDWVYVTWPNPDDDQFRRGWLVRRSISDPTDLAYYFTNSPNGTSFQKIVEVAGRRWAIEECFEQSKQLTGLDEYEVRSWIGWYRHTTLSMLAHATLVAIRTKVTKVSSRRSRKKNAST